MSRVVPGSIPGAGSRFRGSRLDVAVRTAAATVGTYALAASSAAFLAVALPIRRSEAVLTGMLVAIAVCGAAALWAFAARTALRAWLGLLVPTALMAGATILVAPP